jgi:hypothetical protein
LFQRPSVDRVETELVEQILHLGLGVKVVIRASAGETFLLHREEKAARPALLR